MKRQRRRGNRPTIEDVSRLAGVSNTTVSFVINNVQRAGISEETRRRVLAAIADLDYNPHEAARTLGRRASRTIGVAIPDAGNAHYREIAAGAERLAERRGYNIVVISTDYDIERERRCLLWLKQQRIDGLLLCPIDGKALAHQLHELHQQGYPIVVLGEWDASLDNVGLEPDQGERQAIEHLAALGHRHLGYIYGVVAHSSYDFRLRSCLQAQRALGLPSVDSWIVRCGPTVQEAYRATQTLLRSCDGGTRPTALVAINDLLASAVIAALAELAIAVPGQMSVISFDNTEQARYTVVPALTSVDYAAGRLGEQAIELFLRRLNDPLVAPVQHRMPARLIVRGSTAKAPAATGN